MEQEIEIESETMIMQEAYIIEVPTHLEKE